MRWLKQTYDSISSEDIEESRAEAIRDFLTAKNDRNAAAPNRHSAHSPTNQPLTLQGSESPNKVHHSSPKPTEPDKITSLLESFDKPPMTPHTLPTPPPGRSDSISCLDTGASSIMERPTDQFPPSRALQGTSSEAGDTSTLKKQRLPGYGTN